MHAMVIMNHKLLYDRVGRHYKIWFSIRVEGKYFRFSLHMDESVRSHTDFVEAGR